MHQHQLRRQFLVSPYRRIHRDLMSFCLAHRRLTAADLLNRVAIREIDELPDFCQDICKYEANVKDTLSIDRSIESLNMPLVTAFDDKN
jgi:hypothetical protein